MLVGFVQIVGALIGVAMFLAGNSIEVQDYLYLGLLLLSVVASILIFIDDETGVSISVLNYICQVVNFGEVDFVEFRYDLFSYVNIGFESGYPGFLYDIGMGTNYKFSVGYSGLEYFNVNVFAIFIIYNLLLPEDKFNYDGTPHDTWD